MRGDPGEDVPRSMPIILHIPKADPPVRTELLEAAATAVVVCCLDERAGYVGSDADPDYSRDLRAWYGARIRKIARRARNAQWDRVQALPGVTSTIGGASARALVPGPVGEEDVAVAKLQIGGTDLPGPDEQPEPIDDGVPTIWVDADLGMTVGKAAAQVGHGSMLLAAVLGKEAAWLWACDGFPLRVREVPRDALPAAPDVVVHDAGFTEIAPGAATVAVTGGSYSGCFSGH
ncbi:peptidyl-tRNA hydrolase [Corynebacterium sp. NPDC060344]|uniref:peptidyl-tRNA hydrolase n=1 Tax=Corynebacterium sp. NPDC060344 TaxID=3347101 RepID=UPI00365B339F